MIKWDYIEPTLEKYERIFEITDYFSKMRSSIIGSAAPVVIAVCRDGKWEFTKKYPDYVENMLRKIDCIERIFVEYEKNR